MFILFFLACTDIAVKGLWCAQSIEIQEACEVSYCVGEEGPLLQVDSGEVVEWLPCGDQDCSEEYEVALWVCE